MKDKFESLKKLNLGTVLSTQQQKNAIGGYSVGSGQVLIHCYDSRSNFLGMAGPTTCTNQLSKCKAKYPTTVRTNC